MGSRNILYLMHVSWFWIKQRPQFLAEEISKYIPVTVACLEDFNNQQRLNKSKIKGRLAFFSFFTIPFKKKSFLIAHFNFQIKKFQLGYLIKRHKVIWFSSPLHFLHAKSFLNKKQMVIYDCMDNAVEFYKDPTIRKRIMELEKELCDRADGIIVSSKTLKENLIKEYDVKDKIAVVNNAINYGTSTNAVLSKEVINAFADKTKKNIVYIGTVSSWFNFKDIIPVLESFPNLQLVLVGPIDCDLSIHKQIVYTGPVKHDMVYSIMEMSDVLIMPFIINELVKAVNPVKAYEYIFSGKPVILSKYEETLAFEKYVYLYENGNELHQLFEMVSSNNIFPKRSIDECIDFAKENTWDRRAKEIVENIISKISIP